MGEPQLEALRARRMDAPEVQPEEFGRVSAFSGRSKVSGMHPDLEGQAILVSGHHGCRRLQGDRLIIDQSGGNHGMALEAIVLPERLIIDHLGRRITSTAPAVAPKPVIPMPVASTPVTRRCARWAQWSCLCGAGT